MKKHIIVAAVITYIAMNAFAMVAHAYTSPLILTHKLSRGATGADVIALQEFLKEKSFFNYSNATGYFGSFTKDAIIAFQKAYGINPVGIVGPITRAKILELTQPVANVIVPVIPVVPHGVITYSSSGHHRPDTDHDGIKDSSDNCPLTSNANQVDTDDDGVGDACDNCAMVSNSDQLDTNHNEIGDACEIHTFLLTVAKAGSGSGTVTSTPAGIDCGGDCSETYDSGTHVTLSAVTAVGSVFTGWSGACAGTGTCDVTMDSDLTATANFSINSYLFTVTRIGGGTGTVTSSPAGIDCGATCEETLPYGTVVTLTAAATSGSTFTMWLGPCTGTAPCIVTITSPIAVFASFDP